MQAGQIKELLTDEELTTNMAIHALADAITQLHERLLQLELRTEAADIEEEERSLSDLDRRPPE